MSRYLREAFVSGYKGPDSMRDNAERMFASQLRDKGGKFPPSASAPGLEKMRLYKKGGNVKHHPLTKEQTDLHLPRRVKTPHLNQESFQSAENMKRGGSGHLRHRTRSRKAFGGSTYANGGAAMATGGSSSMIKAAHGGSMGADKLRKGGRCKATGGALSKANGGTVYERMMVGERPGKRPSINYESTMRGERPVRKAAGGSATSSRMAIGGAAVSKMAAGGVGKIRHKQATKDGLPINRKVSTRRK